MKTQQKKFFGCISLIIVVSGLITNADEIGPPPYMGQEPPCLVPKVFAPGLVSLSNRYENNICFTKDGRECYFVTRTSNWSSYQIMETRYENGQWTTPRRASFSNNLSLCPSLADDDQSLYFSMSSPNIYRVTRTANGWLSPAVVSSPVSSSQAEWSCHVSTLGNMWICSWRSGGVGGCDLWKVQYENGRFTQGQNFRNLNTTSGDCGPVPGPDEEYIVFMSGRPGGFGGTDLYISYPDGQGGWTDPSNLGPPINTSGTESSAYLSPDYKYLFYSSTAGSTADVYWVSVEAFAPDPNGPILNQSSNQRYPSIRSAILNTQSGQTLILSPGEYKESVLITSKDITIRSENPQDPTIVSQTVLSGDGETATMDISRDSTIKLEGLTICDGGKGIDCSASQLQLDRCVIMDNSDCGVEVGNESSLVMTHCIIAENSGAGLRSLPVNTARHGLVYSDVVITNCTIVRNQQYAVDGEDVTITNSILYFNGQSVGGTQINGDNIEVTFSDVQGEYPGDGNIDTDPLFVDAESSDYHLRPDSPCIDAGNPDHPVGDEPEPNGGYINMGAYGGTTQAGLTTLGQEMVD